MAIKLFKPFGKYWLSENRIVKFFVIGICLITTQVANAQHFDALIFTPDAIKTSKANKTLAIFDNDIKVYRGLLDKTELAMALPILNRRQEDLGSIIYEPLVPFSYEQDYTIKWNDSIAHFKLEIPNDYDYLEVEKIYPSGSHLPENLLKFYIRFSKRISISNVYNHIHIFNDRGEKIERALLPLENALLSEDGLTLTV